MIKAIAKEIAEQTSMVVKMSLIGFGLFFTFMFLMFLLFYVEPFLLLVIILFEVGKVAITFIVIALPMFLLHRQSKKEIHTPDGAINGGILWWLTIYLVICLWLSITLTHEIVKDVPFVRDYPSINNLVYRLGFWCCPIAIAVTSPVGIAGFYFKRWMHNKVLS